ncbi:VOC family protein [Haloarcula japonica]|uniref:Lactoyglutathione lyase n=1 Tax=Haloarcula japonica (strain ATCC 49778 / DSM 6131 / JCM 7785 / NBRC 101032 / NCIMB 13157 / TR-1) TaxID=1227453 RepID=M0LKZ5_HALJT|nr:VOC family protein [Haloarcula japonica]EMA34277.1 putative lactoyglutathione lyase [Haloarcula japonica DSM 6131]
MDLAHTAICVSDLDRAMEFYGALGFEETNRFTLDGVENVYLGRDGDGDLQLRHDPDRTTPIAPNRADVDHIAFTVNDVEGTFETAIDAGAAPVLEPTEVDAADAFAAFVEDPEGYTLEFYRWL